MPLQNTPKGSKYSGWFRDQINSALELYYNDTLVAAVTAGSLAITGAASATTTVTAGTGLTVTTGNSVVTAGDLRVTTGNERLGAVETFATTEPTSALVMKVGTAPVGAITTSGALFSSSTVVRKLIADGTASNVET